uniref:Peptidase A1 domain-containing protein n=1 Tax=Glycine max TaxID=3847 RepID=A0A0R0HKG8_SOYBN
MHRPGSFYQVPKKSYASNGPFTRVTSNNGDYLMKLTLGTPPVDVYGLVDTDSDLVWAQCTPCQGCYKQKNPMFDPLKECNSFFDHSCSPEKACDYVYAYADDSATKGMLAKEIATFSSTDGKPIVESIIFGCGHNNTGVFNENDMGLIGLGGGPLSLVSQMGNLYGSKRFSQCLVPFHADPHTSGTISLGEASDVSGEGVVTTPLVSEEGQTPYLVTLEGISTPETYLPQEFYDRLVEELKVQINLPPIHVDPDLGTQLCYKSETNLEGPILTAHFEGADVKLLPLQTFIPPKDGVFCFAMTGTTDGLYIFGNFAQSNVLIGFDLDKRIVFFKPTDFTKP